MERTRGGIRSRRGRLLALGIAIAGKDGTVSADGYTWRRIADGYGQDGNGGFSVSIYLSQVSGTCFS